MTHTFPNRRAVFAAVIVSTMSCNKLVAAAKETPTSRQNFRIEVVTEGLVRPWSMAFLPGGEILISEIPGKLRIVRDDNLQERSIKAVSNVVSLLDIAIPTDYPTSRWIYLSFIRSVKNGYETVIERAKLVGNQLVNRELVFRSKPESARGPLFGGRLLFGPDGTLFFTVGQHSTRGKNSQELDNHYGKIVRLRVDGHVPEDNPFVGTRDALPEIYSFGHRNVQGITLDSATGTIWIHEHGPTGGDELNILVAGGNYGWPIESFGTDFGSNYQPKIIENSSTIAPVVHWTPAIAPSGLLFYDGDAFPHWKGSLFLGSLAQRHLRRLSLEGKRPANQEILLKELNERIRDVRCGPDGLIYVLTDSTNGKLLRLLPED